MKFSLPKEKKRGALTQELAKQIRNYLKNSDLKPGDRIPTQRDIALAADVSQVTARRAINILEEEGLLEGSVGKGTFLKKTHQPHSSSGARRVGVVLSPWDSEESLSWNNAEILNGLITEITLSNMQFLLLPYRSWVERQRGDEQSFINNNGLDIIVWCYAGISDIPAISRLEERGFPQLCLFYRPYGLRIPVIGLDEHAIIKSMLDSLKPNEQESLMVLTSNPAAEPYRTRVEQLQLELKKRSIDLKEDAIMQLPESPYPAWATSAIAHQINSIQPKVIIDLMGCIAKSNEAILSLGLKLDEDLRLISVHPPRAAELDEVIPYSFVENDFSKVGEMVIKMIKEIMAQEQPHTDTLRIPFQIEHQNS